MKIVLIITLAFLEILVLQAAWTLGRVSGYEDGYKARFYEHRVVLHCDYDLGGKLCYEDVK